MPARVQSFLPTAGCRNLTFNPRPANSPTFFSASTFLQRGLIDEYRVILNPVLLGRGNPLFSGITERIRLKFIAAKALASGVVLLSYQRA